MVCAFTDQERLAGNEVEEIVYKNGLLKDLGNIDDEQGQILEIFPNL